MRALLALAAALALSGCQVDLEGAACDLPGSGDQCPSGQRCGVDQRCSANPLMTCPAPEGTALLVDPAAPAGAPEPTGARSPPACRFRSLDQALAAAAALPRGAEVRAAGAADAYKVSATLAIPPGVKLRGDEEPPAPATHVLSLEGDLAAGVSLGEGATLSGFTVRNSTAPATAVGVDIPCADGAAARLSDVTVEAAGASGSLASGVRAGGACPIVLEGVTVRSAAGAGLLVARAAAASTLLATDVVLEGNGEGVRITRGDVTLERPVVTASAGPGVIVSPAVDKDALLTIDQGAIRANGDTGIVVQGNQAGRLRLAATRVCSNGAATARGGGYAQRKVGGLYLFGNPPAELALEGNALFGNAGDQMLVAGGGGLPWVLDGAPSGATACGAGANLLASYAPPDGTTYVGLFAASATVTARWNAWRLNATPLAGTDYAAAGTGSVTPGTIDPAQWCMVPATTCD